MKTNTKQNILGYIGEYSPVSVDNIYIKFGISKRMIHRHLNNLMTEGKIFKTGSPPKVFYFQIKTNNINQNITGNDIINDEIINNNVINNSKISDDLNHDITNQNELNSLVLNNEKFKILENNFIYFAPDGNVDYGINGFIKWCYKRNLNYMSEIDIYIKTISKYNKYKINKGLIRGTDKIKTSFEKVYLDEIYYLDFYSIEKYGKTYLGNLMFYAKQTGDKELSNKILETIKEPIYNLITKKHINSFAFIPPSIDRKIQLMSQLKNGLNIKLNELKLIKIFKDKVVAQKTLNKKNDRIQNARDTIFILNNDFKSDTILLIDDAVGSGATLNETAKKIKERKLAKKVIGLAIVGSYKGFDVINEI